MWQILREKMRYFWKNTKPYLEVFSKSEVNLQHGSLNHIRISLNELTASKCCLLAEKLFVCFVGYCLVVFFCLLVCLWFGLVSIKNMEIEGDKVNIDGNASMEK